jgi:hypothetical protein
MIVGVLRRFVPGVFTAGLQLMPGTGNGGRAAGSSPCPASPSLNHAARQLGIRNAILTSQLRQLEVIVGTPCCAPGRTRDSH